MSEPLPSEEAAADKRPSATRGADGRFENPWPERPPLGLRALLKWRLIDRAREGIQPTPPFGSLPQRASSLVAPRAAPGHRSATWIGHATVLLQLGPLNILTDPMWSERASPLSWAGPRRFMPPGLPFDALPPIDVVLLSHNHYDHLDAPTIRRIAQRFPDALWLCPIGLATLLDSLGVPAATECDWWQEATGPGFRAACTPARHFSARGLDDRGMTLWCGWTLAADGVRVYFAGDTAFHPDFGAIAERCGPFDLVMLPVGAYEPRWFMQSVHMNPEEAVEAYRALAASGTTPPCLAMHWGTFRLTDEPVEEPPARFARAWEAAQLATSANWTLAIGETRRF
ncbi:MAG TPA: MBL fold metallo-hydrolase [Gemmatimonadaceae bacterium]|nr:MBL fold metallo-hydrolase [Gemmatimonadaceae bacterium]